MIDYSAILYNPVYNELGVSAMLTTTAGVFEITVIDDTRPNTNLSGTLVVSGVAPGAFARIPELTNKGVDRSDYNGSALAFNGRIWIINNHDLRGSPNGEDQGEVRFSLRAE
jgi:hypothetical protein